MIVNSVATSPAVKVCPDVPTTATPNRSGSTFARAGYTVEVAPSRCPRNRRQASSTAAWTSVARGSRLADV